MAGGYQTQIHDEPEDWNSSEWLSKKTRDVQDESLASSRRALQRMREAEDVAASNITKMYTQSEQLHGIERRLDLAEQHVKVSDAKADELKSLSRFFMIPSFGSKKVRKREGKLDKFQGQLDDTAEARRQEDQARRNRPLEEQSGKSKSKSKKGMPHGAPQPYRNYTTPEGVERDDLEQEIDTNLDEMSSGLARLRMAGLRMNEELDSQKVHLDRIQDKTDYTNERLNQTRGKVTRLLK
ncbi:hypothetical protein CXG81DRAFT_10831 [Caulochytrium protostelioides]|uniref:t-SNARE coiled-coil homology domain-containing protein n=1 Tax=Caulochytrium protostelioides TaxID=1555241 RepID=A0A4P9XBE8_9FUNG|nr:hypothetical protein CXG81DRAFT_10831 [Caulochytrium protostelioides]|eukprot:RKP02421.1 hypothetical protein CXG81DRAFT_10831 [Caulochytrium protostelioides]